MTMRMEGMNKMLFSEQLKDFSKESRKKEVQKLANQVASKIIDAASTGAFEYEYCLGKVHNKSNEIEVKTSKKFIELLEKELERVKVSVVTKNKVNLLNIPYKEVYLVFSW